MKSFTRRIIPAGAKGTPSFRRVSESFKSVDAGGAGDKVIVGDCTSPSMQDALRKAAAISCGQDCKLPKDEGAQQGYLSQDGTPAVIANGNVTFTFTPEDNDKFVAAKLLICSLVADVHNLVISSLKVGKREYVRGANFIPICDFVGGTGNDCGGDFPLGCLVTDRTPITMIITNLSGANTTGIVSMAWKGAYTDAGDC